MTHVNGAISEESVVHERASSAFRKSGTVYHPNGSNTVVLQESSIATNAMDTSIYDEGASHHIGVASKKSYSSSTSQMAARSSLMRPTQSFRGKMTFK